MKSFQVFAIIIHLTIGWAIKLECAQKDYNMCAVDSFEATKSDVLEFDQIDPLITKIYFKNCKFPVFPSQIFTYIPGLKILYMRDNGLKQINAKMFVNAGGLTELHFNNNSILILKTKAFIHLKELIQLEITQNILNVVAVNAFMVICLKHNMLY